jgi:hypothetical protein
MIALGAVINIMVGLLILGVSLWGLYQTHYRDRRSDVKIHPEQSESSPEFIGGNQATDDKAFWTTTSFCLKIINEEERGAYVRSISEELVCLVNEGRTYNSEGAHIETRTTNSVKGQKLDPHLPERYRVSLNIIPEDDIGVLIHHDYALIRHVLEVEDNKGSYKTTHITWAKLTGPEGIIKKWEESGEETDSHQ